MEPFDSFPGGGRNPFGDSDKLNWTNSRHGVALQVRNTTSQSACAYCGLKLDDAYEHWLLVQVDHVVPVNVGKALEVPLSYLWDSMNLVLACSGCNGYGNRFGVTDSPTKPHMWTDETFVSFRDEVFRRRFDRIAERREQERQFFEQYWRKQ